MRRAYIIHREGSLFIHHHLKSDTFSVFFCYSLIDTNYFSKFLIIIIGQTNADIEDVQTVKIIIERRDVAISVVIEDTNSEIALEIGVEVHIPQPQEVLAHILVMIQEEEEESILIEVSVIMGETTEDLHLEVVLQVLHHTPNLHLDQEVPQEVQKDLKRETDLPNIHTQNQSLIILAHVLVQRNQILQSIIDSQLTLLTKCSLK